MPGRGFGAGVFEGLTYLQQRQDELDRQAQEMALRNAVQRLNSEEFSYKKQRDVVQDAQTTEELGLKKRQLTLQEQEAKARGEREKVDDATGMLKTLIPQNYSGEQAYPLINALKSGDLNTFTEAVKGLSASPLLAEKSKQQWAKLENTLQGEELRFYRLTRDNLYNTGSITWDEANQEALVQLHAMRAQRGLMSQGVGNPLALQTPTVPQSTQPGSVPVPGGMEPGNLSQFFNLGGGGGSAGRDFGVNARVKSQNDSRAAFTGRTQQNTEFHNQIDPITVANAKLAREGKEIANAMNRAKANEFVNTANYREKMRELNMKRTITQEEIAKLNLDQKQKEVNWRRMMGAGTDAEFRARREADEKAAEIEQKRKALRLELEGISNIENAATVTMQSPYPVETLPDGTPNKDFQEQVATRKQAKYLLDTAPARRQIINEALNSLNTLKSNLNPYRTRGTTETTPGGKPLDMGAVTPPPGTRPNRYNEGKPKLKVGKPTSQTKAKVGGKVDYSKMSDAELLQAFRARTGGR